MKYLMASDIHGSAYYAELLLKKFEETEAEKLILMGDLLYHGARNDLPRGYDTKKLTAMLNGIKDRIIACHGNCDSEVDQMVLEFDTEAPFNLLELNGIRFFQTHGHYYDPENLPDEEKTGRYDAFLFGHIHVPAAEKTADGKAVLNPGSVSIPKGGYPNSYALLDGRKFTVYSLLDDTVIKETEL